VQLLLLLPLVLILAALATGELLVVLLNMAATMAGGTEEVGNTVAGLHHLGVLVC
jgi:hypothetical protein